MIPTKDECLRLLEKHGVPPHIKEHILQVTLALLEAASLLHDLEKHLTFEENRQNEGVGGHLQAMEHGHKTAGILEKLGYRELVPPIIRHRMTAINDPGLDTWEEKILYYADMRVNNDTIVTLPERIFYIRQKYGSRSTEAARMIMLAIPPLERLEKDVLARESLPGWKGWKRLKVPKMRLSAEKRDLLFNAFHIRLIACVAQLVERQTHKIPFDWELEDDKSRLRSERPFNPKEMTL